jgi:hypothetical protein
MLSDMGCEKRVMLGATMQGFRIATNGPKTESR